MLNTKVFYLFHITYMDQPNDKNLAYIAYLIFFIPLLIGKPSDFVRYHVNQGLLLLILEVALRVVLGFFYFVPEIGFLFMILQFVPLVFFIMGLVNVSKGEMKPLPVIGGITLIS